MPDPEDTPSTGVLFGNPAVETHSIPMAAKINPELLRAFIPVSELRIGTQTRNFSGMARWSVCHEAVDKTAFDLNPFHKILSSYMSRAETHP
jgi:hypothetical protein